MSEHRWSWTSRNEAAQPTGAHMPLMEEILRELEAARLGRPRLVSASRWRLKNRSPTRFATAISCDESKQVHVECKVSPERFWLRVTRRRPRLSSRKHVPDCTADENLECPGGRGLALIKAYMTSVEYNECGNCVTMEKIRTAIVDRIRLATRLAGLASRGQLRARISQFPIPCSSVGRASGC